MHATMCRVPVNTEEVDDYLSYVTKPMDLEMMHMKLDDGEYKCAQVPVPCTLMTLKSTGTVGRLAYYVLYRYLPTYSMSVKVYERSIKNVGDNFCFT